MPSWLRPKTIREKLFLIYIGILFIPIILVGYYISTQIRTNQIEVKTAEIEQNTDRTAKELADTLASITRVSDWVYQDERLAEMVNKEYFNQFEVFEAYQDYQQFSDYLKYYSEIQHIRLYVENPTLMSSVGISPVTADILDSQWYREALEKNGQIVWRYMEDPVTKVVHLNLTRAIYKGSRLIGVLSIAVSNDKVTEILSHTGNTFFLTLDDELIFSSPGLSEIQREYGQYRTFLQETAAPVGDEGVPVEEASVKGTEGEITFTVQMLDVPKSIHSEFKAVGTVPTASIVAEANRVFVNATSIVVAVFLLTLLLLVVFIRAFNKRVVLLQESMTKVAHGNFDIPKEIPGQDEISIVYSQLYLTMESLQRLMQERYQYELDQKNWEIQIKDSEFKLLASQINPHFLYNTLEMIRMKALRNQDREVADIVKILSKLMRKALERRREELPLSEELTFSEMYLQIQQLRFGERVQYEIKNGTTKDYWILPLLIQPLVENSFIHGLEKKAGPVRLLVDIKESGSNLIIRVQDNGIGIPSVKLQELKKILNGEEESNRIGISNVNQRIIHFYGPEYGMSIDSVEGEGTEVVVRIPQRITETKGVS